MYRTILIAVDESPAATRAAERAIDMAATFDAPLHALFVVDSALGRTAATKDPLIRTGEHVLNGIERAAAQKDVSVSTALEEGQPAVAILEYARTHGVDLIVLGGKHKSTAERVFIGNTAERIVRHAPMSVLVVRSGHNTD